MLDMDQINAFIQKQSTIDKLVAFAEGNPKVMVIQLITSYSFLYYYYY